MEDIVLDTNVLIMALSAKNRYHAIWESFVNEEFILCVSNEIIEEYLEVISRNINVRVAESIILAILARKNVKRLDPHIHYDLIKSDPRVGGTGP